MMATGVVPWRTIKFSGLTRWMCTTIKTKILFNFRTHSSQHKTFGPADNRRYLQPPVKASSLQETCDRNGYTHLKYFITSPFRKHSNIEAKNVIENVHASKLSSTDNELELLIQSLQNNSQGYTNLLIHNGTLILIFRLFVHFIPT